MSAFGFRGEASALVSTCWDHFCRSDTVDVIHSAPPRKPGNDTNTNKQWFLWLELGAGLRSSTVPSKQKGRKSQNDYPPGVSSSKLGPKLPLHFHGGKEPKGLKSP